MRRRDWSGAQVRGALKARGITLRVVARAGRVSSSSLRRVLDDGVRNPKVERALAKKLGLPLGAIYPSRVRADAFSIGGHSHQAYEGAAAGRRFGTWGAQNLGPNASIFYSLRTLRSRARELLRNNPWATPLDVELDSD
ncbi:MAG: helix-turn-helix domain-containing protein [Candidatus Binatia bacterium]